MSVFTHVAFRGETKQIFTFTKQGSFDAEARTKLEADITMPVNRIGFFESDFPYAPNDITSYRSPICEISIGKDETPNKIIPLIKLIRQVTNLELGLSRDVGLAFCSTPGSFGITQRLATLLDHISTGWESERGLSQFKTLLPAYRVDKLENHLLHMDLIGDRKYLSMPLPSMKAYNTLKDIELTDLEAFGVTFLDLVPRGTSITNTPTIECAVALD